MTHSKPCPRAGKPHCTGVITATGPKHLARRLCCTRTCAAHYRLEQGWRPHLLIPAAARRRGALRGGVVSGGQRRKLAKQRVAEELRGLLPPWFLAVATPRMVGLVVVLLVRAWQAGHKVGTRTGYGWKAAGKRQKVAA